ncbi:hypothetical protein AGABI1DRAFT_113871 [Agaricus bisporus var. burnettii JB137-S8]|uniref:Uncharacterized protein n=1 Tax=Agaricus bisporus var. burnettii (strain JB137-S8 / ATCC MYA-4627 / FGSC 10392) TaxID=597362 RepID=K5X7W9_AGABU|nr:uncharacterized protein AGABI1DRAFT_113871 [Agaricus bisporus var. burnettii JB137-S8]EKM79303.1 hypothetical protein AGABI1DRAFT_113871 [Agaricus bisporus var. burnettii JB137-S8]
MTRLDENGTTHDPTKDRGLDDMRIIKFSSRIEIRRADATAGRNNKRLGRDRR